MILKIIIGIVDYFVLIIAIGVGVKLGLKEYFREMREKENKSSR